MISKCLLCAFTCTMALSSSCIDEPEVGTLVHEDTARPRRGALERGAEQEAPVANDGTLVARGPDGRVYLVDVATGARRWALGSPSDNALDLSVLAKGGTLAQVVTLALDEEQISGRLVVRPFSGAAFARPKDLGQYEGFVRTLATKRGAVVFQEDLGQRWILARSDGAWTPSKSCPIPRSILDVIEREDETRIVALARSADDEAVWVEATVGDTGVRECVVELVAAPLSSSARAVRLAEVGDVVADVRDGLLQLGLLDAEGDVSLASTDLETERIEVAIPWRIRAPSSTSGGASSTAIVVVTSAPPAVVVVEVISTDDDGVAIGAIASAGLRGEVEPAWSFFRRNVAIVSGQLFVASDAGLDSFVLDPDSWTLEPVLLDDDVAALRGPIASAPSLAHARRP